MRRAIAAVVVCFGVVAALAGMGNLKGYAESKRTQNVVLALDHGWEFRQIQTSGQDADSGWLPATVPGDVHLDLLANKQSRIPFIATMSRSCNGSRRRVGSTGSNSP